MVEEKEIVMDIENLKPGDPHYKAYIGVPAEYDLMGASQFGLLCTLGLRSHHYLLDFGCGSLRAGKLFISYLDPGRYFGIEPNNWLIDDGIKNEIGEDQIKIKKPTFQFNGDFTVDNLGQKFDYILAQSIFTHTSLDIIIKILKSFKRSLQPNGIIAATFFENFKEKHDYIIEGEDTEGEVWRYPNCFNYKRSTILRLFEETGLHIMRIPWHHPRQTWYLFAADIHSLPTDQESVFLYGMTKDL